MEISLSFNHDDAQLIEKYAAEQNTSVPDFIKRAVMKALAEEKERAARNAAILAMEKKESDTAGAGPAPDGIQPQGTVGFSPDDVKKEEGKKDKEGQECVLHDAWKKWLMKTFCIAPNSPSSEMLLDKAHQAFDAFLELTAARLGFDKSRSRFFYLCENIPVISRKQILSTVDPYQLAAMLSGFSSDTFNKAFQAMASAYNGKSDEISAGLRESCIALFPSAGNGAVGVRKAADDALNAFVLITAPMIGKTNAVKIFMQLVQIISKSERQKILLAMSPQDFAEMLFHFLF